MLEQKWESLRFGSVRVNSRPDGLEVEVELFLNGMDANGVLVQMYADTVNDVDAVKEMTRIRTAPDISSPDVYGVTLTSRRPITDYTARVIPTHANVSVPLEFARNLWQR